MECERFIFVWWLHGTKVKKVTGFNLWRFLHTAFLCEGAEVTAPEKVSAQWVCAGWRSLCVVLSSVAHYSRDGALAAPQRKQRLTRKEKVKSLKTSVGSFHQSELCNPLTWGRHENKLGLADTEVILLGWKLDKNPQLLQWWSLQSLPSHALIKYLAGEATGKDKGKDAKFYSLAHSHCSKSV